MKTLVYFVLLIMVAAAPVIAQEATPDAVIPVEVVDAAPGLLSLTVGEVIAIVLGIAALAFGVGKILWDAGRNPGGQSVDSQLTALVDTSAADRERMAALERAYERGNAALKTALDATVSVLQTIAPLTPLKVDDAALNMLKDIQQAGPSAQEGGVKYTQTSTVEVGGANGGEAAAFQAGS